MLKYNEYSALINVTPFRPPLQLWVEDACLYGVENFNIFAVFVFEWQQFVHVFTEPYDRFNTFEHNQAICLSCS